MRTTARSGEGNAWFRVTLREGRTRQIRRMFETIGHSVSKLKRVAIGPIRDPALPVGATRRLTRGEVEALRKSLEKTADSPAPPPPRIVRRRPRPEAASRAVDGGRVGGKTASSGKEKAAGKEKTGRPRRGGSRPDRAATDRAGRGAGRNRPEGRGRR